MLATDLAAPSTATMKRLRDGRITQYWDPKRMLSHNMGERDSPSIVWDYIAIYKPGDVWAEAPPKPVFEGFPVVRAIDGADNALKQLFRK